MQVLPEYSVRWKNKYVINGNTVSFREDQTA